MQGKSTIKDFDESTLFAAYTKQEWRSYQEKKIIEVNLWKLWNLNHYNVNRLFIYAKIQNIATYFPTIKFGNCYKRKHVATLLLM